MKELGIGLLGFGTVGAGVVDALAKNASIIAERTGLDVRLKKIADLDLDSDRGVKVDRSIMTQDAASVVDDPEVDIVVELIGGTTIAKDLILRSIGQGKPVVTANKALLAECGEEIFGLAESKNVELGYEASVAGGIPIIGALRDGLVCNRIDSIAGILNGTCNYILTRMEREKLPFDEVLAAAQEAGYAEAEPSLDIDGVDTAHKAVLLASLAYGFLIPMDRVYVEGIRGIDSVDISYARELGYRIKQLAIIKRAKGEIEVRVHPALVPLDHTLAHVSGVFNAVLVSSDIVDDTLYYGKGAGRYPTASAVIADMVDIGRRLGVAGAVRRNISGKSDGVGQLRDMDDIDCRYYLRLSLFDKPGVLAKVAQVLGKYEISVASFIQQSASEGEYVPAVMLTHDAREGQVRAALKEVDALDVVGAETVRYRIEDFKKEG